MGRTSRFIQKYQKIILTLGTIIAITILIGGLMRKFQQFFNDLAQLRADVRGKSGRTVKKLIGDSTENNRTLTVKQAIRYVDGVVGDQTLARQLQAVNEILKPVIVEKRRRTDAIDLSELVNNYRRAIMNNRNRTLRRKVGTTLAKVG